MSRWQADFFNGWEEDGPPDPTTKTKKLTEQDSDFKTKFLFFDHWFIYNMRGNTTQINGSFIEFKKAHDKLFKLREGDGT